jgi:hypothetical protein
MSYLKSGLLAVIVAVVLFIPTGCEDDRPPRVDGVEETTSPSQLGEWMEQLKAIIRATNTSGPEASRVLAYSSIAYYEGYAMSANDMRSMVWQLEGLETLPPPSPELSYNYGIIAEAAMTTVLLHMFENATNDIKLVIQSTYSDHERDYAVLGIGEPMINRSRVLGELIGEAIKDWADADGFAEVVNCTVEVTSKPNSWQPTPSSFSPPELPCWGNLRPFTFSSSQLESICHPGLPENVTNENSSVYQNNINEIIEYAEDLNQTQEDIAEFWSDGPGTYTLPGHYISILGQLIDQNLLDGKEAVTAWAQLSIVMADTYISAYNLKYTYLRPRPVTFIQENGMADWESYISNPATPEYPSLRAAMAFSATQVFINLYGDIEFRDNTHSILNLDERIYSSFTEMGNEAVYSRLYAGTNLRSTLDASEYHGRCIAQRTNELFFNE